MAKAGDTFIVDLKEAHVDWGVYRTTSTRDIREGEGYIPIPLEYAKSYKIYNSNYAGNRLGYNLFNCRSADGLFNGVVKASGCKAKDDIYAKQFQGNGDLKALGNWYKQCSAKVGDCVRVTWETPTDIIIELI